MITLAASWIFGQLRETRPARATETAP
jgi:hypothetical protein